jgi:hypothetical protein
MDAEQDVCGDTDVGASCVDCSEHLAWIVPSAVYPDMDTVQAVYKYIAVLVVCRD